MTIKEIEERTGLPRSNIRFYEKEKLIQPSRNLKNGYRDYSEQDAKDIQKIAYLRTLGLSVSCIHSMIQHEISLKEALIRNQQSLQEQMTDLTQAAFLCSLMLADDTIDYDTLNIEKYVPTPEEYWSTNQKLFRTDSVRFLYVWGGTLTWAVLTGLCLLFAFLTYPNLPRQIPIQYRNGEVSSSAAKIFIFAYPVFCVIIRLFFRIFFRWKLRIQDLHINDLISDYLTNSLCFVVFSVEIFSILFLAGYVENIVILLFTDAVVLAGILLLGLTKLSRQVPDNK